MAVMLPGSVLIDTWGQLGLSRNHYEAVLQAPFTYMIYLSVCTANIRLVGPICAFPLKVTTSSFHFQYPMQILIKREKARLWRCV